MWFQLLQVWTKINVFHSSIVQVCLLYLYVLLVLQSWKRNCWVVSVKTEKDVCSAPSRAPDCPQESQKSRVMFENRRTGRTQTHPPSQETSGDFIQGWGRQVSNICINLPGLISDPLLCYSPAPQHRSPSLHRDRRLKTDPPQWLRGYRSSTGSRSDPWQSSDHSLTWRNQTTRMWWRAPSGQQVQLWGSRWRRGRHHQRLRVLHCCLQTPSSQVRNKDNIEK